MKQKAAFAIGGAMSLFGTALVVSVLFLTQQSDDALPRESPPGKVVQPMLPILQEPSMHGGGGENGTVLAKRDVVETADVVRRLAEEAAAGFLLGERSAKAMESLNALGGDVAPILVELLEHENPEVRLVAVHQLVSIANSQTLPALLAATAARDKEVGQPALKRAQDRATLFASLHRFNLPPDQAVRILQDAATHSYPRVRMATTIQLAKVRTKEALVILASMLKDRTKIRWPVDDKRLLEIRHFAAAAMEYATHRPLMATLLPEDIYKYEEVYFIIRDGLSVRQINKITEAWQRWWEREGKDFDPMVQEQKPQAAANDFPKDVETLLVMTDHSEETIRRKTWDRLLEMGSEATPELIRLLQQKSELREAAVKILYEVLCETREPKAVSALLEAAGLTKGKKPIIEDPELRAGIVMGMNEFGLAPDHLFEILRLAHQDKSAQVRIAAIEMLAVHPSPEKLPLLMSSLDDQDWKFEYVVDEVPEDVVSPVKKGQVVKQGPQVYEYAVAALECITGKYFVVKFLGWRDKHGRPGMQVNEKLPPEDKKKAVNAWREWWKKEGQEFWHTLQKQQAGNEKFTPIPETDL